MATSFYQYDDLTNESIFRLFHIGKSQTGSTTSSHDVEIHLFEASFNDPPAFEAVSYAWGQSPASSTILCNGKELLVTPNVAEILHVLSAQSNPTAVFWIDSICINQSSIVEKNIQVPRMRSIYSEARLVWLWLGKGTYETKAAMSFLLSVGDILSDSEVSSEHLPRMVKSYTCFKGEEDACEQSERMPYLLRNCRQSSGCSRVL